MAAAGWATFFAKQASCTPACCLKLSAIGLVCRCPTLQPVPPMEFILSLRKQYPQFAQTSRCGWLPLHDCWAGRQQHGQVAGSSCCYATGLSSKRPTCLCRPAHKVFSVAFSPRALNVFNPLPPMQGGLLHAAGRGGVLGRHPGQPARQAQGALSLLLLLASFCLQVSLGVTRAACRLLAMQHVTRTCALFMDCRRAQAATPQSASCLA